MVTFGFGGGEWTPGDSAAAEILRSLGVDGVRGVPTDIGIQCSLSEAEIQDVIEQTAGGLGSGLPAGSIVPHLSESTRRVDGISSTVNSLIAWAMSMESLTQYQASGIELTSWMAEKDACAICSANTAAGDVRVGSEFPSGHKVPPAHADCRCTLL
jgi:hypothetical protein